jgi:hypothetical protein
MRLSSVSQPSVVQTPRATADFNVHVLRSSTIDENGVQVIDTQTISVDPSNRDGGFVFRDERYPGYSRMSARHIQGSDAERAAAQGVRDAVLASGLLAQAAPATWIGRPDPGLTRIYFDRRSTFVEFPNDHPTPGAQAVLDAVAAWAKLR